MSRWFVAALLLCPLLARADLKQYIDEQTMIAGEADLTKVNGPQVEAFMRDIIKEAGLTAGQDPAMSEADVTKAVGHVNRVLTEVSKAGGQQVYVVTHLGLMKTGGFAVIVPAAPGGDAKKLASLLFSGRSDGPTRVEGADARAQFAWSSEVINGNVAVLGTGAAITYARMVRPASRPDMEAGLNATAGTPIRAVFAPPQMVRAIMSGVMPPALYDQPSTAVTQGLQWIAGGMTAPPTVNLKFIAQASDTNVAKQLHHIATYGLAEITGVPPQIPMEIAQMITPTLAGSQLTVTADKAKIVAFTKELVTPMREARRHAQRVAAMSNMRQILMACQMYSAENKGKFPEDLKALGKYLNNNAQVMKNPARPDVNPPFIYIKPASQRGNTSQRVVLYESHKEFGTGICVGFLDGHVEFMQDKNRFDQLLAETEVDKPAP
jgi:hypothetical protein